MGDEFLSPTPEQQGAFNRAVADRDEVALRALLVNNPNVNFGNLVLALQGEPLLWANGITYKFSRQLWVPIPKPRGGK